MTYGRFLGVALAVLLLGCDGEPEPTDAGPMPPTECDPVPDPLPIGDPDGHPDPLGAAPGESRAGRLTADQLPADHPTGMDLYAAGDLVIANDRFALLIEDAGASDGYDPFGGRPIGIASVEGGALVRAGDFNELLFGLGTSLIDTEQVTVLADGSDGGAAVIRATGPLGPLEFVGDLLSSIVPGSDTSGLPAAMDYEMAPGADAIAVSMTVQAPTPDSYRLPLVLAGSFQRYRMPIWTEEHGFGITMDEIGLAVFADPGRTSYALLAPEGGSIQAILEESGTLIFDIGGTALAGCTEERVDLGTILLGGPGLAGMQRSLARHRGETLRTVTGTVTHADGSPAPEARVHVRRADGRHFSRLRPEEDGTFALDVPEEDVELYAFVPGFEVVGPVAVPAGTASADLTLAPRGTIAVTITGDDMVTPIPARVQVIPAGDFERPPSDMGERTPRAGRAHVAFPMGGSVALEVAPGDYDVVVSRGFEHELYTERVTVAVDATVDVTAALARVVDSTGVMCADYHIHTYRSPDSPDSPQLKLQSLVADGLEIAIRSDHEWVNDFEPVIAELGIESYVRGVGGEELTTFQYGHFGVFPLQEDRSMRSGSAIEWVGRLPPETFAAVRARPEQPALIINHPRSSGNIGGYFNAAGFDRTTGMVANADHWDEDFTMVEVFNDDSFDEVRDREAADWFALLASGRRVFAVGSSDSHDVDTSPVGYPRTCLRLGTDDPRAITPADVRDVTAAGASVISGGILLDVSGPGGEGPGETVSGAGDSALFDLTVQAPSWIGGDLTLEIIVDGETTETIPITEMDRDMMNPAVRLRASGLSVPVDPAGSWVVFHVSSDGDLAPLYPGRSAFGVSNPVFLTP